MTELGVSVDPYVRDTDHFWVLREGRMGDESRVIEDTLQHRQARERSQRRHAPSERRLQVGIALPRDGQHRESGQARSEDWRLEDIDVLVCYREAQRELLCPFEDVVPERTMSRVGSGSEDAFACEEVAPELGRGVDSGPPAPADVGEADVLGTCGLEEAEDVDEELGGQVVYADDHPCIFR